MDSLIITKDTKPSDAFKLPEGRLLVMNCIEASFSRENVADCVELIKESGSDKEFYSQAGIVMFAGNTLGWGMGGDYKCF
jgi:hypothetical protein